MRFQLLPLLLLVNACIALPSPGQKMPGSEDRALDSLLAKLNASKEDTSKVKLLNAIAWKYKNTDIEQAIRYGKESLALAERIKYLKGCSSAYNDLGVFYKDKSDYSLALDYYMKGLKIRESMADSIGIATSYNNIGNIYYRQGKHEDALSWHFKALKIRVILKDSTGLSKSYNNIGGIYGDENKFELSLKYHFLSLELREKLHDAGGMSASYNNIGLVYEKQHKFKEASDFQFRALQLQQELNDKRGIEMSYFNIGNVYLKEGNYKKAIGYYEQSLKVAGEIGRKEGLKEAYAGLFDAYQRMKDYKKAFEYHLLFSAIKDTIFNSESTRQLAEMQTKYESEKKEKEIELLTKKDVMQRLDNQQQKNELNEQRLIRNTLIAGSLFLIVVAFLLYNRYKLKQASAKVVERQRDEISQKNKDMVDSIRYAQRIQEAIFPPNDFIRQMLSPSFVLFKPRDIVSGDFYWVEMLGAKDRFIRKKGLKGGYDESPLVFFAAVDCTGHGVPGAFMSIVGHNALTQAVKAHHLTEPAEVLDFISDVVSETLRQKFEESKVRDGMDIALCSIDYLNMELQYAGAYNPLWLVRKGSDTLRMRRNDQEIELRSSLQLDDSFLFEIQADRFPIGSFIGEQTKDFSNHRITLQENDCFYVFTDGYADQFGGEKGKKFKYKRLQEILLRNSHKPMNDQRNDLDAAFEEWKGKLEQVDDVLVIGVKI
ncbi:MAG TPA: tetratricopeptide repeat protein [Bacteroidia bacterium]